MGRDSRCCADIGLTGHSEIKKKKFFSPRLGPFIISKVGADRCSGTSSMRHWKNLALLWLQWNADEKVTGKRGALLTPLLTKANSKIWKTFPSLLLFFLPFSPCYAQELGRLSISAWGLQQTKSPGRNNNLLWQLPGWSLNQQVTALGRGNMGWGKKGEE